MEPSHLSGHGANLIGPARPATRRTGSAGDDQGALHAEVDVEPADERVGAGLEIDGRALGLPDRVHHVEDGQLVGSFRLVGQRTDQPVFLEDGDTDGAY